MGGIGKREAGIGGVSESSPTPFSCLLEILRRDLRARYRAV